MRRFSIISSVIIAIVGLVLLSGCGAKKEATGVVSLRWVSDANPAREAVCQSNLKQIGLAIFMYAQDNGGWPPTGYNYTGTGTWDRPMTWDELLLAGNYLPYPRHLIETLSSNDTWNHGGKLKYSRELFCPSIPATAVQSQATSRWIYYGINWRTVPWKNDSPAWTFPTHMLKLDKIAIPSRIVLIAERETPAEGAVYPLNWNPFIVGGKSNTPISNRHLGGSNVLWYDGHVTWVRNAHYALTWPALGGDGGWVTWLGQYGAP